LRLWRKATLNRVDWRHFVRGINELAASFQDDHINRTIMKKLICLTLFLFTAICFSQSVTGEDELYEQ